MAAMKTLIVFAVCLFQPSSAANLRTQQGHIATIAVHMYEKDCGLTKPISLAATKVRIPGAGMSPDTIEPFVTVLKDGFYLVDCVADYMFTHGDKFGDHSDEYKLGGVSNVSIVLYEAHVPKEDKDEMTHEVCFAFCRTIPDMNFFGINNGRECYCMTYYQAMADDSSMCDAPCDGNPTTMCGGKSKSSIFGMHACDNTASKLQSAEGQMMEVGEDLHNLHGACMDTGDKMQSMAEDLQEMMGQAGDPGSSDLAQTAKQFAGELEHAASAADKILDTVKDLKQSASGLQGADFQSPEKLEEAEKVLQDMQMATTQCAEAIEELEPLHAEASPMVTGQENATFQYYPTMYFVDKKYNHVPSTCTGTPASKPKVATLEECAVACNKDIHECVGIQYFPKKASTSSGSSFSATCKGLCFTFSKMKTVKYWTGGQQEGSASSTDVQLQNDVVTCAVKFSEFEGTTLKPDPSGKCKICLKEASKFDRSIL